MEKWEEDLEKKIKTLERGVDLNLAMYSAGDDMAFHRAVSLLIDVDLERALLAIFREQALRFSESKVS